MNTLKQLEENFELYADRPLLIDSISGKSFSYNECHTIIARIAWALSERLIGKGDRVALVLPNSTQLPLFYLSCLYLGAVSVLINPKLSADEIRFELDNSGSKLIVYSSDITDLPGDSHKSAALWDIGLSLTNKEGLIAGQTAETWLNPDFEEPRSLQKPFLNISDNDLFSITFTSGTTERPKAVAHRIGGLLGNAIAFNFAEGIGPDNRFMQVFPMTYMAGFLNSILSPLMAGASIVIAPQFDAQTALIFWKPVIEHEVNSFWMAPTMLEALLRIDRDPNGPAYCQSHVDHMFVGTAPLSSKTKIEFENRYGVKLLESYGLSELLIITAETAQGSRPEGSVGKALPSVEVRLAGEYGVDGEILIKTPHIMAGYLDYETLEPDFIDSSQWYPTGDIGHLDSDGCLKITGREKDLIIRGGLNVSPRAVEEVLLEHEAIAEVSVLGMPHDFYGQEVVAAVRLEPGRSLESEQRSFLELCRHRLSEASIATRYVVVDHFPKSATGKIQKNKLREYLGAHSQKE